MVRIPRSECSISPLLLTLLIATGCGHRAAAPTLPALEDVNVLLIIIDSLGRNHVGCMTPGLDTTPRIDRLAHEGVFFRHAYATAPWTKPAIGSLLTGLTPSHHGVLHLSDVLPAHVTTLAEYLAGHGFATSGIITIFLIDQAHGYAQGFRHFDETAIRGDYGITSPNAALFASYELDRLKDQRFFLMVHLFDPHNEYLHHAEFDRTSDYSGPVRSWNREAGPLLARRHEMSPGDIAFVRDLYREEVAFTDHHVGVILDKLASLDLDRNTLVILTADHGEEFMEHDWIGHTRFLYDTLMHVPLIFRLPGRLAPQVVDEPAQSIDVVPTLLAMAGRTAPVDTAGKRLDGVSLLPTLRGGHLDPDRPLFMEVAFLDSTANGGSDPTEGKTFLSAISRGPWHLIHDLGHGSWSLYDRSADPGEVHDLLAPDELHFLQLQPRLKAWEASKVEKWGKYREDEKRMTPEDRQKLRSLGYLH